MPRDHSLTKGERITQGHEYKQVIRSGHVISRDTFRAHLLIGEGLQRKAGFIAGKTVGNACNRNRAKRLLKETYRRLKPSLRSDGFRIVFISKLRTAHASQAEVNSEMNLAFRRYGLFQDNATSD